MGTVEPLTAEYIANVMIVISLMVATVAVWLFR
jgi:hypothetical protein